MTVETNDQNITTLLRDAEKNFENGETVLDFSSVTRVDADALRSLEQLAAAADQKSVKLTVRGANVDVYKVLKLVRLARRFQFLD